MEISSKEVKLPRAEEKNQQEISKIIDGFLRGLEEGKHCLIILEEPLKSQLDPMFSGTIPTKQVVVKRKSHDVQIYCFVQEGGGFINVNLSLPIDEIAKGKTRKTTIEEERSLLHLYWMLRDAIIKPGTMLKIFLCPW